MLSLFERLVSFVDLVTSSIGTGGSGSVIFSARALSDGDADPDAEQDGNAELYGVAGFLFRPRDQDSTGLAEAVALRQSNGLLGIASRDLRIWKARGALPKGSFSMASYTGAHVTLLDAAQGSTTGSCVAFQPTQANSNAPHALVLDGAIGAEKITITHALGHKVTLDQAGHVIIQGRAGTTVLQLDDAGGVTVTKGGGALKVALEPPITSYLTNVNASLAAIKAAGSAPNVGLALAAIPLPGAPSGLGSSALAASP